MDFQAILNVIMSTNATGTPPVPSDIPSTSSNQNCSTNNSEGTSTPNPKKVKEQDRRAKTNQRFEELHNLIKKDGDGEMSQANILKAACQACIEHKRKFYSDPRSRGLIAGLQSVEQVTTQHFGSLNFPSKHTAVPKLEKLFEDFRDVILPVFTPIAAPVIPSAPSTSDVSSNDTAEEARKKKKKRSEQKRRDNQGDGYGLLKQFIRENNLFKTGDEKIQVLECIIRYLKYEPVPQPSQTAAAYFSVGFIQGRYLGLNLAIVFLKSDAYLSHLTALYSCIEFLLRPINSLIHTSNFQFDNTAIVNFMSLHPTVFGLIAAITPPPTVQAPVANNTPAPQAVPTTPGSIWRTF